VIGAISGAVPVPITLVFAFFPYLVAFVFVALVGMGLGYGASYLLRMDSSVAAGAGMIGAVLGGVGGKIAQLFFKFDLIAGDDPVLGLPIDFFAMALIGALLCIPCFKLID
jgi:hypothetical protein